MDSVKSWAAHPDVCRCCLSASGNLDLTASFISEAGSKQVYTDIIEECFGISMSYLVGKVRSLLVCQVCTQYLHDAQSFRKQILLAEKQYKEFMQCNTAQDPVRIKIKDEYPILNNDNDNKMLSNEIDEMPKNYNNNTSNEDDNKIMLNNENETMVTEYHLADGDYSNHSEVEKLYEKQSRNKKKQTQPKGESKRKNVVYDSDTPLACFWEKCKATVTSEKSSITDVQEKQLYFVDPMHENSEGAHYTAQKAAKSKHQVSERKRMRLTFNTIFRYTTACLFRHHKSWFQCFFCHKEFIEINILRQHNLNSHTDIDEEVKKIKYYPHSLQIEISNLECRECGSNLTDIESMRRHFADVHNMVIYNECIVDYKVNCSPYFCHICNQEFHVFRMLTTHLNEHYAYCICDVCGKSFLNSKRLKAHKRTHEFGSFPCTECGKILKTKASVANHIESVHSKRVLKCQICHEPMKHYHDRIKHMSELHNITHKFKCHICNREYNIKHYLATHIRQTHGHKNKKCAECGMAFITNHGLKKHMLKHSGVKQFSCDVCCKSYVRSHTLREHMRTHIIDKFLKPD